MGTLGRSNMPVLTHPEFWTHRRLAVPGREPFELPATSRRGLADAGFSVVEQREPSFLFHDSLLVHRGGRPHERVRTQLPDPPGAARDTWEPDPAVLDDQALIAHVAGKGLVVVTGSVMPGSSTSSGTRNGSPA